MILITQRLRTFPFGVGAPVARLIMPRIGCHVGVSVSRAKLGRALRSFGCFFFILLLACSASRSSLAQSSITIFSGAVPANPVEADPNAVTLGVKFWSTQPGNVSGIRFFRGYSNSSGYTVQLFTAGGSLLAQGTASNDTCSVPCWEQVNFASPISISANTTYVATYYTSNGFYADGYYGLTSGAANGPLVAPASGASGGNGVYVYAKGFPASAWKDSNYYVDVAFTPSAPSLTLSFSPPNPSIPANAPPGTVVAKITATWSSGAPFTGTLTFGAPNSTYSNDNGAFAISGNDLIVSSGPDVSSDANTIQNVTVVASQ
jgi:hypothetical protein